MLQVRGIRLGGDFRVPSFGMRLYVGRWFAVLQLDFWKWGYYIDFRMRNS